MMNITQPEQIQEAPQQKWQHQAHVKEYMSAVNPPMPTIDVIAYPSQLHQEGETRVIPFDLSRSLKTEVPATSPNLMANFLRICVAIR